MVATTEIFWICQSPLGTALKVKFVSQFQHSSPAAAAAAASRHLATAAYEPVTCLERCSTTPTERKTSPVPPRFGPKDCLGSRDFWVMIRLRSSVRLPCVLFLCLNLAGL